MTVANTNVSSSYNCNGVTREWNIGFHYNSTLSGLSIVVLHADGTSTDVTANYEIESGVLTYPTVESELDPLPEGDVITITRITPLTQNINLVQQGPLDAEALESGYDKATIQIQEVASQKQDKLIAGENIVIDEDGTISASGTISEGVYWGNVHGTLSNQTDLLAALNSKANVADLATVATTGDYEDLLNKPTIPTDTEDLTNGAGYQTASDVSSAITSGIAGKADTNLSNVTGTSGFRRLVDVSDPSILPSWYKVFDEYNPSTGAFVGKWCEQGGRLSSVTGTGFQTIILPLAYANTNYSLLTCANRPTSAADFRSAAIVDEQTITVGYDGNGNNSIWETRGYLPAEEE